MSVKAVSSRDLFGYEVGRLRSGHMTYMKQVHE